MIHHHKRRSELFPSEKKALLPERQQCRKAIIEAGTHLDPWSRTYELGGPVIKAIDGLAEELTGDPKFFHAKSSTR